MTALPSMPPYAIRILPAAQRALAAIPDPWQDQVRDGIDELAVDPFGPDTRDMECKATGLRRLRVGRYRVVYRVSPRKLTVLVVRIGHRSDVYRGNQ
jgi:mRNA interferase RelE/StbE